MQAFRNSFLILLTLLTFSSAAYSQIGEIQQPAEQYRRYAAGTVDPKDGSNQLQRLYLATYDFKDVPGKSGFLGLWGNRAGIFITAVNLTVHPGYMITVCGTFAGTKKDLCLPKPAGTHPLKEFSNVRQIRATKLRVKDQIVMWYGQRSLPVAIDAPLNMPPGGRYFNSPHALWVPEGYWVRLCTTETPSAGTCKIYTADANNITGKNEYIKVGKGKPPAYILIKPPKTGPIKIPRKNSRF